MNGKNFAFRFLLVVALLFACPVLALSQSWHTANQVTIGWNASDGSTVDPVIPQDQISYRVYLTNFETDPEKANPSRIGETADTQFTITLNTHGRYIVGVSAIRTVEGEVVGESDKVWSDEANPAFGIQYYSPPPAPSQLVIQ